MFPLVLLFLVSGLSGCCAGFAIRRFLPRDPAGAATRAIGGRLRRRKTASFFRRRLEPAKATGLALTVAVVCLTVVGTLVGVLAFLVRTQTGFVTGDERVAAWAGAHATVASTQALRLITQLGSTVTVVVLAIVVSCLELRRARSAVVPAFLALVGIGQAVIVDLIKFGVDRARPEVASVAFGPGALFSGASFPSGHSAAAAAYYASFALIAARGRPARVRATLDGVAVAIAVAVATSRVLLRAHWLSDVVAGLAIGWGWFVLCAVAFGGRMLLFGAPVDMTTHMPTPSDRLDQHA